MAESTNKGGAPEGNQNLKAGQLVRGAIRRALHENEAKGRESLLNIVQKLIAEAETGSIPAASLLFDRIDGKANQPVTGEDGEAIKHAVTVRYVGG
jgi:hypothetical protein